MDNNNLTNNIVENTPNNVSGENTLVTNNVQTNPVNPTLNNAANLANPALNNTANPNLNNIVPKKKNNMKIIAIVLLVVAILFIVIGVIVGGVLGSGGKSQEDKNKALAKEIFESAEMDDYLKEKFVPGVVANENLLDSKSDLVEDIYNDDSIKKYYFYYSEDEAVSWLYVKYEDYAEAYKKHNNKEMTFKDIDTELAYYNLVDLGNNKFKYDPLNVISCNKNNIDICYVSMAKKEFESKNIKFDSFNLKEDNIVVGHATHSYISDDVESVLEGDFELKYKKDGRKYTAEYIKFTSLDETTQTNEVSE